LWNAFVLATALEIKTIISAFRCFANVFAIGALAIVIFVLGALVQRERTKEIAGEISRTAGGPH
jgi:hypothetical protein